MRANTHVQALIQSDNRPCEEVMKPSAAEMPAKVADDPCKRKIPFGPCPPPNGWTKDKWECFRHFEQFERMEREKCECAQHQSAASGNRGPIQSCNCPPPQRVQSAMPLPQCIQGSPPQPPQDQQSTWNRGCQAPTPAWNQTWNWNPPPPPPELAWKWMATQQLLPVEFIWMSTTTTAKLLLLLWLWLLLPIHHFQMLLNAKRFPSSFLWTCSRRMRKKLQLQSQSWLTFLTHRM